MHLTSLSSLVTEHGNLSVRARTGERQVFTCIIYEGSQNDVVAVIVVDVDFDIFNNEFRIESWC